MNLVVRASLRVSDGARKWGDRKARTRARILPPDAPSRHRSPVVGFANTVRSAASRRHGRRMRSELCNEPQNLLEHLLCRLPDGRRRRQRAQKITEIVAQRMKLEPHGIGGVPRWCRGMASGTIAAINCSHVPRPITLLTCKQSSLHNHPSD